VQETKWKGNRRRYYFTQIVGREGETENGEEEEEEEENDT